MICSAVFSSAICDCAAFVVSDILSTWFPMDLFSSSMLTLVALALEPMPPTLPAYESSAAVLDTASRKPCVAFAAASVFAFQSLNALTARPIAATAAVTPSATGLKLTPSRLSARLKVIEPLAAREKARWAVASFIAMPPAPKAFDSAALPLLMAAKAATAGRTAGAMVFATLARPWKAGMTAPLTTGMAAFTAPLTVANASFIAFFALASASAIVSFPMASSVPASPRVTAVCRFAIDVATPPDAVLACSAKAVTPSPPSLSSLIMALSRSSIDRTASFLPPPSAAYRSLAFAVGPSMALASWSIWPGMADVRLRQSSISGLPFARIWRNCSIAALVSSALEPDAMSMSFSASPASVASVRSPVVVTNPWTSDTMESSDVGKPCSRSSIVESEAFTTSVS